jgi:TolA-binding protein
MNKLVTYILAGVLFACPALLRAEEIDTPEEQLAAASALFDAKKYAEAAQRLDAFIAANPKHARTGAAAYALGRARAELKQFDKAVPAYEKAIASKDTAVLPMSELGLGEAAMNTRQYDKAIAALTEVVKTDLPVDQAATAWYWIGQANYQLGKFADSQAAYDHIWQQLKRATLLDSAYYGAGVAAQRQGKSEEARQRYRVVVDRYPKSDDRTNAMLGLAMLDVMDKRWPQARTGLESLLAVQDLSPDIRASAEDSLIQALLELQDYAAVIPHLEAALTRAPANDPARYRIQLSLGTARYRQKQYEPALAAYLEAAKSSEEPIAAQGLYWAGNAQIALNRSGEAASLFQKLSTRYPNSDLAKKADQRAGEARTDVVNSINDPSQLATAVRTLPAAERAPATIRLARLYLQQKKAAEAAAVLVDLVKTNPPAPMAAEANYLLGVSYDSLSKDAQAESALATAVKAGGDSPWIPDARSRLAWLYINLKQPEKAEAAANAALAGKLGNDAQQQTRLALLQSYIDQMKWDQALNAGKSILASNPPPDVVATVLFTQAWTADKRGMMETSLPIWDRLATEFPKSPYAAEALLHVGDARMKAEKFDEARDRYSTLVTNYPKSPLAYEARYKLGSALYNTGKPGEAAVEFDAVANDKAAGSYAPESLYWAGVALDKAGNKTEAIQRLTKLVAQYPTHARIVNAKIRLAALKAVGG